jgi:hypothetical protein
MLRCSFSYRVLVVLEFKGRLRIRVINDTFKGLDAEERQAGLFSAF